MPKFEFDTGAIGVPSVGAINKGLVIILVAQTRLVYCAFTVSPWVLAAIGPIQIDLSANCVGMLFFMPLEQKVITIVQFMPLVIEHIMPPGTFCNTWAWTAIDPTAGVTPAEQVLAMELQTIDAGRLAPLIIVLTC